MSKNKKTKILYSVCVYMIENKEKFKNHKIYEDVLKGAISPKDRAKDKVKNKDKNTPNDYDVDRLYHLLLNTYKFLTGESTLEDPKDPCIPLGYAVMPRIDVGNINETDQELIQELSDWMAVCYDYLYEKDNVSGDRLKQYKRELRQIDVNKTFSLLDELVGKINAEYVEELIGWQKQLWLDTDSKQNGGNKPEPTEYFKVQEGLYNRIRREVLEWPKQQDRLWRDILGMEEATYINHLDSLDALSWCRKHFHNGLSDIFSDFYLEGHFGNLCAIYISWMYVDLCCCVIMQSVNQRLVINPYVPHEDRMRRLHALNDFMMELVQKTKTRPINMHSEGTRDENMFYFFAYYHMKDRFLQDIYVLKYLKQRCGSREDVDGKYSLLYKDEHGRFSLRYQLASKERYQYFIEGEQVSLRSFYANIKNCERGMDELARRTGRGFTNKEIDLKAFYREIYLDKTTYNDRQSKSIFNLFVENKVMQTSAYYFIDEKINMGICREWGAMDEFWLKNDIQENLYHLVCIVLAELRPLKIKVAFDEVLGKLLSKMKEIFSMFVYDPNLQCYQWHPW